MNETMAPSPGSIILQNLGKAYKRYPHKWARLREWAQPSYTSHKLIWVLRSLNLLITPGQAVGIIGRNGSGKSTLLKLITGTSVPSEGRIQIQGRIAALLELGM